MRRNTLIFALLALQLCSALAIAASAKDDSIDEMGVDRYGQKQVRPLSAYVTSTLLVSAATGVQVMTPGWIRGVLGSAGERGVGALAVRCVDFLNEQKRTNPLGLTLAHGVVTKACADVLAQTIPQGSEALVWLDPLRGFRSMLASLLSTSMPFYFWTRFMARSLSNAREMLGPVFGQGLGLATFKTVVTQALFRPINIILFLSLQSIFRGDSCRKLVHECRSKFRASLIGGVIFYSISNLLMYSVPVPFLHPIMGSVAGLIFNVWLAIVAYRKA